MGAVPGICDENHRILITRKHPGQPPIGLGTVPILLRYTVKKYLNWRYSGQLPMLLVRHENRGSHVFEQVPTGFTESLVTPAGLRCSSHNQQVGTEFGAAIQQHIADT